jgi:hypothetical protein
LAWTPVRLVAKNRAEQRRPRAHSAAMALLRYIDHCIALAV